MEDNLLFQQDQSLKLVSPFLLFVSVFFGGILVVIILRKFFIMSGTSDSGDSNSVAGVDSVPLPFSNAAEGSGAAAGGEPHGSISSVAFQCPAFWVSNPRAWFLHLESIFALRGIRLQLTKYHHVISALPQAVTEEIIDLLENIPEDRPYDVLKDAILRRTTASDSERVRKLLTETQLGDRKPSQLLRQMRSLAGRMADETILRELWFGKLPKPIAATLAASKKLPLEDLAEMADAAMEHWQPLLSQGLSSLSGTASASTPTFVSDPAAQARIATLEAQVQQLTHRLSRTSVTHRRPSRQSRGRSASRSSGYCWYHARYGPKARDCDKPCSWRTPSPSPSGNDRAGR